MSAISFFTCAAHLRVLADISANPCLIMDIIGHNSNKTSMIYIHSLSERVKRQLQSLTWKW
ncbi:MAG: hypothetical protein LBK47_01015 [Prevotellaceae bacterium]|nr:hypothetical protein [Prevotellaceae bacterium]